MVKHEGRGPECQASRYPEVLRYGFGVPPEASSPAALARMKSQKGRDTKPELELRRLLHAAGFRYRVDFPLPGLPRRRGDIVFPRERVAVMVCGCYWHGCPQHATWPKANADWWRDKIESNVARDLDTDRRLTEARWLPIRVWEHEDPAKAAKNRARRSPPSDYVRLCIGFRACDDRPLMDPEQAMDTLVDALSTAVDKKGNRVFLVSVLDETDVEVARANRSWVCVLTLNGFYEVGNWPPTEMSSTALRKN